MEPTILFFRHLTLFFFFCPVIELKTPLFTQLNLK